MLSQIEPKNFRPKKPHDDFFSNSLYRWMLKNKGDYQVWRSTGEFSILMIGTMDDDWWFHGCRLAGVTFGYHRLYAYPPSHDTRNWEDVTEWFWERYAKIGICAIHEKFPWHRWDDRDGKIRTCLNCGVKQKRKTIRVPKVIYEPAL